MTAPCTKTLYLIRGVSGAGKTTLAETMRDNKMIDSFIEADMFFGSLNAYMFDPNQLQEAHAWCQAQTRILLEDGLNVAVSNTSTTEKEVEVYSSIAKEMGVNFVSLVVENRSNTKTIHSVPDQTIEKQRKRFSIKL